MLRGKMECCTYFRIIPVDPSDFYYLNRVSTHKTNESLAKTWLFYKVRNLISYKKKAPTL